MTRIAIALVSILIFPTESHADAAWGDIGYRASTRWSNVDIANGADVSASESGLYWEVPISRKDRAMRLLRDVSFFRIDCNELNSWGAVAPVRPVCRRDRYYYIVRGVYPEKARGGFTAVQDRNGVLEITYVTVGSIGAIHPTALFVEAERQISRLVYTIGSV